PMDATPPVIRGVRTFLTRVIFLATLAIRAGKTGATMADHPTAGDDTIFGDLDPEGTDDFIDGLGGNNQLLGGFGDDTLHGSEGNDNLAGHEGSDILIGDAGNDRFSDLFS